MEAVIKFFTDLSAQLPRIADALEKIAAKDTSVVVNVDMPEGATNPPPAYPAMPQGMHKPENITPTPADWSNGNLVLTTWKGGAGTLGNPALVDFRDNGSAILSAKDIGGTWNSGVMQIWRPAPALGRFGAVVSSTAANAVLAFFMYSNDGTELDFELVKRADGSKAWALNVHMKDSAGARKNPKAQSYIPVTDEQLAAGQHLEIDFSADAARFLIDGKEVAAIKPADMPSGTIWKADAKFATFLSVEKHAGWAGWQSADYAKGANMTVYGIQVPGLPAKA